METLLNAIWIWRKYFSSKLRKQTVSRFSKPRQELMKDVFQEILRPTTWNCIWESFQEKWKLKRYFYIVEHSLFVSAQRICALSCQTPGVVVSNNAKTAYFGGSLYCPFCGTV